MIRFTLPLLILAASHALASDLDEFKVKRQEVFEFTEKPSVTRDGDKVTITFTSKAFCDATVAVENAEGKIIRHLASGVLGPNAPAPFQKSSLRQTLVWDGKNDKEEYVDDKEAHTVRVSLGLKAQFERTLFWSPKKRTMRGDGHLLQMMQARPEGVYVSDGTYSDHVYLFDHDGNYVRTVFPPPADKLDQVLGLEWRTYPPDGLRAPVRGDLDWSKLLTTTARKPDEPPATSPSPTAMLVSGNNILLANIWLNRLSTDGSTGGKPLHGPRTGLVHACMAEWQQYKDHTLGPYSMALSPDGRWLYLAGYTNNSSDWIHGLFRLDMTKGDHATPELLAGRHNRGTDWHFNVKTQLNQHSAGTDNDHLTVPTSVAVDRQGRVYVTDYGNNRVQVFSSDGKLLKTIPVKKPAQIQIDPKTQQLWVFSFSCMSLVVHGYGQGGQEFAPALFVLASYDDPKVIASYPLELAHGAGLVLSYQARAEVDFYTDPPTIWLSRGHQGASVEQKCIRLLVARDRKLEMKRDFVKEVKDAVTRVNGPGHNRWRMFCNPKTGKVYIGEDHFPAVIVVKGFSSLVELDPETGKVRVVPIPFDAEDMAFDPDGNAYLRTEQSVARYDSDTWREVPFDYGEAGPISYQGLKNSKAQSAIVFAGGGNASSQLGGMWVSPKGHVVVHLCNPNPPGLTPVVKREKNVQAAAVRKYEVRLFPGRAVTTLVHVFDKHGKILYDDAVPGVGFAEGIAMDKDDNLYMMAVGLSNYGDKPYPEPWTCSIVKLKPNTKVLGAGLIPLPLAARPNRTADVFAWRDAGTAWIGGAEWVLGGVGMDTQGDGRGRCHCSGNSRFTLDYFGRSFAPEIQRFDVVVVDSAGNAIIRIGRYGSVDDGLPLVKAGPSTGSGQTAPPTPRSIGGDEVALFNPRFVATHTDRRLFIGDRGNERVLAVKLGYHAEERVALKNIPDRTEK